MSFKKCFLQEGCGQRGGVFWAITGVAGGEKHRLTIHLFAKMSQLSDVPCAEGLYAARHCGTQAGVVRFTGEGQLPWDWLATPHLSPPPLPRSFVVKRFAGSPNRQRTAAGVDSDWHMLATLHVTWAGRARRSQRWQDLYHSGPSRVYIEIFDTAALPQLSSRKMQSVSNSCNPPDARRWERCRCIRREVLPVIQA